MKCLIKNKRNGITLVSLVITIIILLILAGVTISILTGENGLINNAIKTKEKAQVAEEIEQVQRGLVVLEGKVYGKATPDEIKRYVESENKSIKVNVFNVGTDEYILIFENSGREYSVNSNYEVSYAGDNATENINKNSTILSGSGTETEPIEITSIEDLLQLSFNTGGITVNSSTGELVYGTGRTYDNSYIILKNNLDFKKTYSYVDCKRKDYGDVNGNGIVEPLITELTTGSGFIPIGNSTATFNGNFNGSNFTISNLMINTTGDAGLFGNIKQATISNLTLSNCDIKTAGNAGGIIGIATSHMTSVNGTKSIEISNCVVKDSTIESTSGTIGGIIALASGTNNNDIAKIKITNCKNYAVLTGIKKSGGIVGYSSRVPIDFTNCYNHGLITGQFTGGILSHNFYNQAKVNFTNCYNYGDLTGTTNCAGIISYTGETKAAVVINKCANYGKVTGTTGAGGLAIMEPEIYNSINFGEISGGSQVGGLVSKRNYLIINSCNVGKVSVGGAKGELVGLYDYFSREIKNSYVAANYIHSISSVIVGSVYNNTLDFSTVHKYTGMLDIKTTSGYGAVGTTANEYTANDLASEEGLMATLNSFVNDYNSNLADGEVELVKWKMGGKGYPVLEFID